MPRVADSLLPHPLLSLVRERLGSSRVVMVDESEPLPDHDLPVGKGNRVEFVEYSSDHFMRSIPTYQGVAVMHYNASEVFYGSMGRQVRAPIYNKAGKVEGGIADKLTVYCLNNYWQQAWSVLVFYQIKCPDHNPVWFLSQAIHPLSAPMMDLFIHPPFAPFALAGQAFYDRKGGSYE